MSLLPRLIYRFNVMPVKFPTGFIVHIDKLIPKFIWKCKGPRVAKTTLKKKNEVDNLQYLILRVMKPQ